MHPNLSKLQALFAHPSEAAEAFRERLERWRDTAPRLWAEPIQVSEEPVFFQTGDELIGRIVRSIQLNQSVVLSGPRGCGKSRCIIEAIKRAEKEGIIPPTGWIKVQGNKEIPRDYLAEDGLTFRFSYEKDPTTGVQRQVINPAKQGAPFFRFAKRHRDNEEPVRDGSSGRVECEIRRDGDPTGVTRPLLRFVVFLDEINRFSDGVLDSLLSVLEERTVILNAVEYKLPVVVCMTMNPPGYDATARKLSPPLAARIGRSYRLYTPDLDVLSDVIMEPKLQEHAEGRLTAAQASLSTLGSLLHELATPSQSVAQAGAPVAPVQRAETPVKLREQVVTLASVLSVRSNSERAAIRRFDETSRNVVRDTTRLLRAALNQANAKVGQTSPGNDAELAADNCLDRIKESLEQLEQVIELEELFPVIKPNLTRKVALITLCLWGAVPDAPQIDHAPRWPWQLRSRKSDARAGLEYLTTNTLQLLRTVMVSSDGLRRDMTTIGDLCHFGPDGRAGSDWLLTAIGVAIERGRTAQIARLGGQPPPRFERVELTAEHLVETVVECVAHKIYDKFSAASQPALTARKEQAVLDIARRVLYGHSAQSFDKMVERKVDDSESLWLFLGGATPSAPAEKTAYDLDKHLLREQFIKAGVTKDQDVELWCKRVGAWWDHAKLNLAPACTDGNARKLIDALQDDQDGTGLLVIPANKQLALSAGFSEERHRRLAERLKRFQPQAAPPLPLSASLAHQSVWPEIGGPPRSTVSEDLQDKYEAIRRIGLKIFIALCAKYQLREADAVWLADASQQLWDQKLAPNETDNLARSTVERLRTSLQPNRRKALVDLLFPLESAVLAYHGREGEERLRFLWRCRTTLEETRWRDIGSQYQATGQMGDATFVRVCRQLRLSEDEAEGVALQLQKLWALDLQQGAIAQQAEQAKQAFSQAPQNCRTAILRLLDPLIRLAKTKQGNEGARTQFLRAVKNQLRR